MRKKLIPSLFFLLLIGASLQAQSFEFPSDYFFAQSHYQMNSDSAKLNQLKSFQFHYRISKNDRLGYPSLFTKSRFLNWAFNKNFITINDSTEDFRLVINPIIDFRYFQSDIKTSNSTLYLNARGVAAECYVR